jgi:LysM repeat protein
MEETTFRNGYAFARLLVEKNLTKDQVQQLFKSIETRATRMGQTGAGASNRTGLGQAKDATTQAIGSVQNMLAGARKWVKERPTYQAVDTEYNKAMTALGKVGGNSGEANAITKAIYKYRDAAKKYPRAAGLAKWAIITAAGLATGGLGGAGVAAGLAAIDSALKDKELVDIVGDAGIAALVSGGIQGAGDLASAASDAYNGVPSASDIAANNAALGNWNDTDIPGGPASNINGLDLPPDQVAGLTTDGTPNIVGPEAEGLTPEELANAAAQAKAYGFDGDVTLDQLNQAIMQTAEPGTVPADYSQLGAGAGSSTYTVTADDFKGLGKIAQDNGLTAQQLWDANPQITDPDKIFIGQEINIPAASGEPVKNVWQDWEGGTKPTAPAVEPGLGDTVPKLTFSNPNSPQPVPDGSAPNTNPIVGKNTFPDGTPIERTPYGNSSQEYMKQFGGSQPNQGGLPGYTERYIPQKDGSWLDASTGKIADPAKLQASQAALRNALRVRESVWSKVAESVRVKVLPNNLLIDNKLTVMAWALNESTNRDMGHGVQLTKLGVRTIFENIGRYRQAYLKEYVGAPTTDYGHPTAYGAPVDATAGQSKQGWFGKTLDTIGKGVDKVAGWAGNVGHNIITKVTADKLNNAWNRAGEPYDSDKIYDFLLAQKVPKEVIDNVYQRMTLTAPAKTGGAQRQAYAGTNPATDKPWTVDELQARMQSAPAPAPAMTGGPTAGLPPASGEEPADAGAGAFGNMAGQLAKGGAAQPNTMANAPVSKTNTSKPGNPNATPSTTPAPGATTTSNPAGFNATNVMQMKGMEKYAKPPAPVKTANFGQQGGGYAKVNQPTTASYSGMPGTKTTATPTTAVLPAGGGAGVKAAAQTKPGFLQTATDKIADKSKTQSMNSNDTQADTKKALDARRAAGLMAYESKTNESRILQALKRPVAEMLQMVETKEDVQRIKQFVDDTFVKYGAVTESAFVVRNRLIEHVTQVGAQRRREHARKS